MKKTPIKSIREKCLECSNGSRTEVKLCPIEDCPLFIYRFGKNPNRKGIRGIGNTKALKKYRLSLAENAQN